MKLELFYSVRPNTVSQPFGTNGDYYRANGINIVGHNGIDFVAVHGQPVYAAHDGICYPEVDDKGGNGVVIRTEDEFYFDTDTQQFISEGEALKRGYMAIIKCRAKSIYWHLVKSDAVVKTGEFVKAGDLIGYADSTGLSTGDHLHFGLKPQVWNEENWTWMNTEQNNGYLGAVDPMPYFNGFYADSAQTVLGIYNRIIALLKAKVAELTSKLNS